LGNFTHVPLGVADSCGRGKQRESFTSG
jgi:hypothetical protein